MAMISGVVDPSEVDRGDAETAVGELTLDDVRRRSDRGAARTLELLRPILQVRLRRKS